MAQKFFCKWCGKSFEDAETLSKGTCYRNPTKSTRHRLYEGTEKASYACKYCGCKYSTLTALTENVCSRNPLKGGKHDPAF